MDPIVVEGDFRPWDYLVSHLQLLLHARTATADGEPLSVHFQLVYGHKLRRQYKPLVLQEADPGARDRMLDFARVSERTRPMMLCLTLPTEDDGFVVCGVAAVRAMPRGTPGADGWYPEDRRTLFVLRHHPDTGTTITDV